MHSTYCKTLGMMLYKALFLTSIILIFLSSLHAQPTPSGVAQIRVYQLKSGSQETFHQLVVEHSIPLLKNWNISVHSHGPSLEDENGYYLVRTFENVEKLEDKETDFYNSKAWQDGPREKILALIKDYSTLLVPKDSLSNYSLQSLTMQQLDQIILGKLNAEFIQNFIHEDVEAHEKIIHQDFICINGNGTISDRGEYMEGWASAYTESGYTSFSITDEKIRIFDDIALVRSKTVYTKQVNGKTVHGNSLYTDTYIKEDGKWQCVQAHITPVTAKQD